MTAALHQAEWFAELLDEAPEAWGLHTIARSWAAALGYLGAVPERVLRMIMGALKPAKARKGRRFLEQKKLWVKTAEGYLLLEEPQPGLAVEPPPVEGPSAATLRKRRQRDRQRDSAPVSRPPVTPPGHAVTGSVTPGVTERDRPRDIERDMAESSGFLPPNASVTSGVTSLASAHAHEENSPSFSLPTFQKEEGEGEENSPPLPPPSRPAVTPPALPTLTGPLGSALAGALAAIPGAPRGEVPEGDPLEAQVARAAELWSQATGHGVDELRPRDLDALRVRVQEGEPLASFRAAFAHAASDAWYGPDQGSGDRLWPRLVCASKWAECLGKGRKKLGAGTPAPSSQRRPVEAAPPSQSAPAPPPETLPIPPGHHPARPLHARGATYRCLPAEGIALRLDLYLARQQAQRSEAAE